MSELKALLGKKILYLDGGSGSILQSWGLKPGELPETWNISNPEKIIKLGYDYYSAGSNIIYTNTFGAYKTKFGLNLKQIIAGAIDCAKKARDKINAETSNDEHFIAYDVGPCGKLLSPMGDLDFEDAVDIFKTSIKYALECGVDCIAIETMNDAYETKAAVIAAKEAKEETGCNDTLVFVTNVYDKQSRLLTGANPEVMVSILEGLGVDAIGLNCSLGPKDMIASVERLIASSSIPVIVKPNAGIPKDVDGKTVFEVTPEQFANEMAGIAELGACILGGCCGTTPLHIKELKNKTEQIKVKPIEKKNKTIVSSYSKIVEIGGDSVPVLIGERINPTGKKKFKEALRNNDVPYIIHQGLEQEANGAHVLDVNVGLPEIDEKSMMVKIVTELQGVTDLPLQIDTSSPEVMEAALRRYNGKPLVNSVNGKQVVMDAIFPLVKKYGGVVVGLTIDEDGIPETTEGRIKIVEKIYKNASKYGIDKKDIIIDSLTMAVSSNINAAKATLEAIRIVKERFNGNSVLGVSNISFGLPNREVVTSAFFTLAMNNGLSAAIMNPLSIEMMKAWNSFVLLSGKDKDCLNYINFSQKLDEYKQTLKPAEIKENKTVVSENASDVQNGTLKYSVIHGLKEDAATQTKELLEQGKEAVEVIDGHLIPGLDFVGKNFEEKKMYLPQLLMAAEAAKSAFLIIKEYLEKTGKKGESKGTCILATVHGDIHDIGKNIVKVLLENYDFTVIDLGKDVPPEKIVEECKAKHIELVGLSALMTTTVPAMKETIIQLRKECPWVKVCVGGAVMTQEYADSINADFYGKDAMDTVKYAQKVFC